MICFREPACKVGGVLCPMWDAWFAQCEDADPRSIEQDRDPEALTNVAFDPEDCARPETCRLAAEHFLAPPHATEADRG